MQNYQCYVDPGSKLFPIRFCSDKTLPYFHHQTKEITRSQVFTFTDLYSKHSVPLGHEHKSKIQIFLKHLSPSQMKKYKQKRVKSKMKTKDLMKRNETINFHFYFFINFSMGRFCYIIFRQAGVVNIIFR